MARILNTVTLCLLAALPALAQTTTSVVVGGGVPGQILNRSLNAWWEFMPAHALDPYGYPGLVGTTVVPGEWDRASLTVKVIHFASGAPAGSEVRVRLVFFDPTAGEIVSEHSATVDVGETIDEPAFDTFSVSDLPDLEPGGIYTYRLERITDHVDDTWVGTWYLSALYFEYSTTPSTVPTCGRLMSEGRLSP
jgi:hypothetical protein